MNKVVDLIKEIEKRPSMYLGSENVELLHVYILGWVHGAGGWDRNGVVDLDVMKGFQYWIEKKFDIHSSQSWSRIISFYSVEPAEGLHSFFIYFNEWLEYTENNDWSGYLTREI